MNNAAEVNQIEKKTTYSFPVFVTGGIIISLFLLFAIFGAISTAKVSEPDTATIDQAKTEAKSMVPVQNSEMKETIETALIDSQTTNLPTDLNLRNPFAETVSSDRTSPVQSTIVQPKTVTPTAAQPQNGIQPGNKKAVNPDNRTMARKMAEKPSAPAMPSFESRYKMWEQQIAAAQINKQPEPSVGAVYSVSEVAPTGYLASGERKLVNFVVLQNAEKLSESFSLEQGERLFDAFVSEITDAGVIYQFANGQRSFTAFSNERDLKSRETVPTQPIPPVMNGNPNTDVSKFTDDTSIDVRLAQAIAENYRNSEKENLLAFADLNDSFTNAKFFHKEFVVRKSSETDGDYFHQVSLFETANRQIKTDLSKYSEPKKTTLSPCDESFVGETIRYTSGANLTLNEFLRDLQKLYGVSFIVDKEVPDDGVVLKVLDKPWNYVLEAILRSKNLEARCLTGDIISIEPKGKQQKVDQENQKTEPLVLRKYTLRYIPLNSSNTAQIAGSVGGNGGGSNSGPGIEGQINQLLNRGGDNRASVSKVPNSNILAVYATEKQQQEIDAFLKEIDQPGFQVIIETNFYTVNDSAFKDIGGQFSVIVGNSLGTQIGGITNLPPATSGGTGGTTGGGLNPGNVSGLPSGFGTPNNNLRANGNTLFGGSFTVGTATFQALFSAAQQKGLANSQARSTQAVLDGGTTEIKNGDTIIIPTTGAVGGSLVNSGAITVNATQSAALQPQVVVDKNGNPVAVTLNLQLTNNAINRAFLGTATPVVATQSQSGTVRLPLNQTYVVSGFFTDSVVNTRNNTPGLSKVPLFGEFFKRRTDQIDRNRLYFAISVRVVRDTELIQVPAPSDIDTTPVPPPDEQKPGMRKKDK